MASSTSNLTGIGFIGLGAMGFGMASNLLGKPSYRVEGYDIYAPSADKFAARGGIIGKSPKDVASNSRFLICMAVNELQVEDILFGKDAGALQALPLDAIVLICSTVSYTFHETLVSRIVQAGRQDIRVLDCPVSGGTERAAAGTLTIFASGADHSLQLADGLLKDMSEKLYLIHGGVGAASKVKMVNQHLVGIHIAAASQAMALAAKAGLDTRQVYDVIVSAAGNSWAFENRVPHMLDGDWTPRSALDIFVKDMGIVVSTARKLQFPVPLASAVEQLYISGSSLGYGEEDDAGLVRLFLPGIVDAVQKSVRTPNQIKTPAANDTRLEISKIGMIGLGAMGQGMAGSLVRAGYAVSGYDVYGPSVEKFLSNEGSCTGASSPADCVMGAKVVVLMVQNASQVDDVLFGADKAVESLANGAVIILSSTVPPPFVRDLGQRLSRLNREISLIDAPVSGGVARAANGTLTVICSGEEAVISTTRGPLLAMAGSAKNLWVIQGGVGAASSVKLVNQLLAGVHIAAAAEAMAFASRLGLDTESVFKILNNAAAWSWMFENRVPQILNGDWTPYSALSIFVKDLGIVLDEAKRLKCFAPLSSAAHTLYLFGAAHGLSEEADVGVVRLWQSACISVSKS